MDESDEMEALARLEFEAIPISEGAHDVYVGHWPGVAIALTILSKTPEETRQIVAGLEEEERGWETMIESLAATRTWLKDSENIVSAAMMRLGCGLARQADHAD